METTRQSFANRSKTFVIFFELTYRGRMKFQIFLSFVVGLFAFEFNSAVGGSSCLSYLGPNSRYVNIDSDSRYYIRVLTPAFKLPIVTIHERNGKQVYDDQSFETLQLSRLGGRYLSIIDIDLGEGLTLEGVTHPRKDTTRFHLIKSFKVPSDGSEVKIRYELTQGSVQIGSHSEIRSLEYKLSVPLRQFRNGRFAFMATETYVRWVFGKGSPLLADIAVTWSMSSDVSDDKYIEDAVFTFAADGTLDRAEWHASESRKASNAIHCAPWKSCAELLFGAVFNKELGRLIGLSTDLVQEIAGSAERREALDIVKLLSFAPRGPL